MTVSFGALRKILGDRYGRDHGPAADPWLSLVALGTSSLVALPRAAAVNVILTPPFHVTVEMMLELASSSATRDRLAVQAYRSHYSLQPYPGTGRQ